MKYYIIGPYPPPLGGISVYIYRYVKMCQAQGKEISIINPHKINKFKKIFILLKLILNPRRDTFHLNEFNFKVMFALILRPFGGKIIFHDHSGRFVKDFKGVGKIIFKLFLKKVNECILVEEQLKRYYVLNNFQLPTNTIVCPAFLPPPFEEETKIRETYDSDILSFINNHKPLIIANGSQIKFHQGIDLYGLDLCVELVGKLKQYYDNSGLLFALAEIGDQNYFDKIISRIKELGISENFCFMKGHKELWPLFKNADLMIRPTNTDGDAISIREALYFNCPVIASDVSTRPEGTILFKNRDLSDLLNKVKKTLDE